MGVVLGGCGGWESGGGAEGQGRLGWVAASRDLRGDVERSARTRSASQGVVSWYDCLARSGLRAEDRELWEGVGEIMEEFWERSARLWQGFR